MQKRKKSCILVETGKYMGRFCKKFFFFFLLWASVCVPRANLTVKDIQIGTELKKTRLVFVLSHPISLYPMVSENDSFLVKAPEDTFWKIPKHLQLNKGAVIDYEVKGLGEQRGCYLRLAPYTRLVGNFLKGKTYILEFVTEEPPPPPLPEPLPEEIEEAPAVPEISVQAPTVNIQQTLEVPKNEINALTIVPKEDGTTWIIVNSDKQEFFESQIVPETRKLYLYLPKINWPSVQTQVINSGSVLAYAVDESTPGASAVVMDLSGDADIIDLLSTPNLDGTCDFVLILTNRKATDLEMKRLAEKRVELKGMNGANKSLSFTLNPPQTVSMPAEAPSYGQEMIQNREESLFDPQEFSEERQEPGWVSEARNQQQEK
jgi:hypothetical protein